MTNTKLLLSVAAAAVLALNGCGGGSSSSTTDTTTTDTNTTDTNTSTTGTTTPTSDTLSGKISADTTLTADTVWKLDGKVVVESGATLTIEAGTTVIGVEGTDAWLMVMPGAKLMAEGTEANPILFTSEVAYNGGTEAPGQWGGVTLIGNSDNDQTDTYEVDDTTQAGTGDASSGSLKYVTINNTGIAVEQDKEINGLSLFGVSSATTVDHITVNNSGDDGIEIWGGTVNLTNITIVGAQDDGFDTDLGWTGTVDGLVISEGKYAGIEMSGTSTGTYKNVDITVTSADSEGGLYFKGHDGEMLGGHFENVEITYNTTSAGCMVGRGTFDKANASMTGVVCDGSNTDIIAKDDTVAVDVQSAADIKAMYDAQ